MEKTIMEEEIELEIAIEEYMLEQYEIIMNEEYLAEHPHE